MSVTVIDTSVAVKWFVDEAGTAHRRAMELLQKVERSPGEFAVPELFFNEMLAVLCRLVGRAEIIQEYVAALEQLGLARVGNGHALLAEAAAISKRYDISGYDAVFAATAKLLGGTWCTADSRAAAKMEGAKFVSLL